ncbi:fructosamine kinase family protein [Sulfobacillus thermosulfidooxidans]|uniref:fructosamine kinase family protein n=1 Tax=Sulfobacillus thermosulfidooxidans TaxID=28034 RepID=UPI0006B66B0C|nr:fructosamine kinase family protein [Sulfobacillus thermosulfidooxidans]
MSSWQELIIQYFGKATLTPLTGGSLAESYVLSTRTSRYFVKYYDPSWIKDTHIARREASALKALKQAAWPVPDVILSHDSFLVLSWIDHGSTAYKEKAGHIFGERLAKVHQHVVSSFSLPWGNGIGIVQHPSSNYFMAGDFYWEIRLAPLVKSLSSQYPFLGSLKDYETPIRQFLNQTVTFPTLVHGDLWSGNFLWQSDSSPYVIDPASYYGDPVSDIAFSELFGGFPRSFYHSYWLTMGSDPHYPCKKPIYQLYHALVHLKLFGQAYIGLSKSLIDQIRESPCLPR